jgi:hypothetical protein
MPWQNVLTNNLTTFEVLGLEKYMLYAHGSDLCHDSELRHAMANCFEAVMGAVFLDGGIDKSDKIFAEALFGSDPELHKTWTALPHHPLQLQAPTGDRHFIKQYPLLKVGENLFVFMRSGIECLKRNIKNSHQQPLLGSLGKTARPKQV